MIIYNGHLYSTFNLDLMFVDTPKVRTIQIYIPKGSFNNIYLNTTLSSAKSVIILISWHPRSHEMLGC